MLARVQAEREQRREAAREDGLPPSPKREDGVYEHYIRAPRSSREQIDTTVLVRSAQMLGAPRRPPLTRRSPAICGFRSEISETPQGHATDWMEQFWVYVAVEATIHAIEASGTLISSSPTAR